MDYSGTFARHFARLVWLLRHDAKNVDEQKVSLRALVTLSRSGPVTLVVESDELLANDQRVARALAGVPDVISQMAAQRLRRIEIGLGSAAADLLGLARTLAGKVVSRASGTRSTRKPPSPRATTITVVTLADVEAEDASSRPTVVAAAEATRRTSAGVRQSAPDVSALSHAEVLGALDKSPSAETLERLLSDLIDVAEYSARIAKPGIVADILHGVVSREARLREGDARRTYARAVEQLSKPALLRAVAPLIIRKPQGKQYYYEVLERAGEEGANAVIEQIVQARSIDERKAYLDLFVELTWRVAALRRMLGDSRWFVVRNAIDLLGEMHAIDAEADLIALLRHPDDRVRRSATNALLRFGTAGAMKAIFDAVSESASKGRLSAVGGAARKESRATVGLVQAIEEEQDADVQLAMIAALGRIATSEAVDKLAKIAAPDAKLARKRRPAAIRIAAVQALGQARTGRAIAALRALADDRDDQVREAVGAALALAQ